MRRPKSKWSVSQLVSQTCQARGQQWRDEFSKQLANGATRYFAAVHAESLYGPHEFQRGVCALAITEGRVDAKSLPNFNDRKRIAAMEAA